MRTLLSRRDLLTMGNAPMEDQDDPLVHIASLLLQVVPARVDDMRRAVAALPDVQLHVTENPTRFAVVLEGHDERVLAETTQILSQLPGVLTVSIVAHLAERQSVLDQEMEDASA